MHDPLRPYSYCAIALSATFAFKPACARTSTSPPLGSRDLSFLSVLTLTIISNINCGQLLCVASGLLGCKPFSVASGCSAAALSSVVLLMPAVGCRHSTCAFQMAGTDCSVGMLTNQVRCQPGGACRGDTPPPCRHASCPN